MPDPFVNDPDFTLHVGDALETLQTMPAESVHCCVTSPPYWGLRDYGTGSWAGGDPDCDHIERIGGSQGASGNTLGRDASHPNRESLPATGHALIETRFRHVCGKCGATRVDQQLGLEPTPDQYITRMVAVFREVRRVLRADGTLWLNIGDSYAHAAPSGTAGQWNGSSPLGQNRNAEASTEGQQAQGSTAVAGLKPKDLCGIPWRLAFALQTDGWYLRSDIIWSKPNPMPESVTDRPTKAHEYLFLLTKSPRYFYDADAIREPQTPHSIGRTVAPNKGEGRGLTRAGNRAADGWIPNGYNNPAGRNKRSVWEIATEPYPDAHFATFPQALVEPCIKAGTSEHGCCPVCGAPWVREVDRPARPEIGPTDGAGVPNGLSQLARGGGNGAWKKWREANPDVTTGWRPSCDHNTTPVPAVVLDPFLGSGTTAQVARRLGRKSIGIELNPTYAELAARRLQQQTLFACVVDESAGLKEQA